MKDYFINKPFMARKGQFGDEYTLCIGIVIAALAKEDYRCFIGRNRDKYYIMTYDHALEIVAKYGEKKTIWHMKGKAVFILPINEFEVGERKI